MNIEEIIEDLKQVERELLSDAHSEAMGGNIVKEATYRGQASGVLIAINILNDRISKTTTNEQDSTKLKLNDLERMVQKIEFRMKCAEERLRMLEKNLND